MVRRPARGSGGLPEGLGGQPEGLGGQSEGLEASQRVWVQPDCLGGQAEGLEASQRVWKASQPEGLEGQLPRGPGGLPGEGGDGET